MESKLFKDIASEWVENKRKMVKYSTYCAYKLILHTHLLPLFGDREAITEADAQKMVVDKMNAGLSRKTVRDILAALKAIMKYAAKHYGTAPQVWEIEYPRTTEVRPLPVLSKANHRKLLAWLAENPTRQNIGIMISLCTGMRIGEVCGLKWEDVDMQGRIIIVRRTAARVYNCEKKATEQIISTPKTQTSNREIPIGRELLVALRKVRRTAGQAAYVVGGGESPKEPRSYRDYLTRLLRRLNIPRIVFHGLRHTFATRCIECGCDYKTVSTILGHSNVTTTLTLYVHPNIDQKKRCIDKYSRYLYP